MSASLHDVAALRAIYAELVDNDGFIDVTGRFNGFTDFRRHYRDIGTSKSKTHVVVSLHYSPGPAHQPVELTFPMTAEDLKLMQRANPALPVSWSWYSTVTTDMVAFNDMFHASDAKAYNLARHRDKAFPWPDVLEQLRDEASAP